MTFSRDNEIWLRESGVYYPAREGRKEFGVKSDSAFELEEEKQRASGLEENALRLGLSSWQQQQHKVPTVSSTQEREETGKFSKQEAQKVNKWIFNVFFSLLRFFSARWIFEL